MKLEKLKKIDDLRTVWKHEALNFTPWLAQEENMNILGETIGLEISEIVSENKVGNFSADIVAKDINTGRIIVIENQLETSNHDHLGKSIIYASGTDASVIIWIVKEAKEDLLS